MVVKVYARVTLFGVATQPNDYLSHCGGAVEWGNGGALAARRRSPGAGLGESVLLRPRSTADRLGKFGQSAYGGLDRVRKKSLRQEIAETGI